MCFDKCCINVLSDSEAMYIALNIVKHSYGPPVQCRRSESNTREPRRNNAIEAEFGQKSFIFGQKKSGISSKIRSFNVHSGLFMGILDFESRTPGIPEVHAPKSGTGFRIPEFRTLFRT